MRLPDHRCAGSLTASRPKSDESPRRLRRVQNKRHEEVKT